MALAWILKRASSPVGKCKTIFPSCKVSARRKCSLGVWVYYDVGIAMLSSSTPSSSSMAVNPTSTSGVGGSMARFAIVNHILYGLDGANLDVVDISSETHPVSKNSVTVAWGCPNFIPSPIDLVCRSEGRNVHL